MLRLIHAFDVKPGVHEESFVEWLDATLWEKSRAFGCLERKTWRFLDGIEGTYETGKPVRRPRYLNEAFWSSHEAAENFRKWLLSAEAKDLRARWFASITNHTVLRYVDYSPARPPTDD
jgi:hypothetical protein